MSLLPNLARCPAPWACPKALGPLTGSGFRVAGPLLSPSPWPAVAASGARAKDTWLGPVGFLTPAPAELLRKGPRKGAGLTDLAPLPSPK